MKHIFIINPNAGTGMKTDELEAFLKSSGYDWEIFSTSVSPDAVIQKISRICRENSGEVRFYACGGDGTLNAVVNGMADYSNASVACYPCGSGNDFVKYYGGAENFRDFAELCSCENYPVDLIKVNDIYSINVVNFGFDTYVAKTMDKVRKKPVIGGRNAYTTGIAAALVKAMKNHARIIADGEVICDDVFFLCTIANGKYVGGAYQCAPYSVNDDGLMELCLIKPISYVKFAKLIKPYSQGRHIDDPNFKDIMIYRRCRRVEIDATDGFAISVDGEILSGKHFVIEAVPSALKFGVPAKAAEYVSPKEKELLNV